MDVNKTTSRCRPTSGSGISLFREQKIAGYTLIEVMLTIAVVALIAGFTIPSLKPVIASSQLTSQINILAGGLALSRSEAVKRGQNVMMCQSNNLDSCSKTSHWEKGWIIYEDRNRNKQREPDEILLYAQNGFANSASATYNGAFNIDGYIYFEPDGSAFPNGSFTLCAASHPEMAKALILIRTGRVRLSKFKADGSTLECPNS